MPDLVLIVRIAQLACAACWLFPMLTCWPSVARILFSRRRDGDILASLLWFMAASQLGFIARWLLWGAVIPLMRADELIMWAGMYVLSGMIAIAAVTIVLATR